MPTRPADYPCLPPHVSPLLLLLEGVHPQVRAMIEALLAHEAALVQHHAGTVRLCYHRTHVKVSLEIVL